MHLIRRGAISLTFGATLTTMVFLFRAPSSHLWVTFVAVSTIMAYLLWMGSLLVTWTYWGGRQSTPRQASGGTAAAPINIVSRQHNHMDGRHPRAS